VVEFSKSLQSNWNNFETGEQIYLKRERKKNRFEKYHLHFFSSNGKLKKIFF